MTIDKLQKMCDDGTAMNTTPITRNSHSLLAELIRKGLASRRSWGIDFQGLDRRHALYSAFVDAQKQEQAACPATIEYTRLVDEQNELSPHQRMLVRQMCRCGWCS